MAAIYINWEGRCYGPSTMFDDFKKAIDLIGRHVKPIFCAHIDVGFVITDNPSTTHADNAHGGDPVELSKMDPNYEFDMVESWDELVDYTDHDDGGDWTPVLNLIKAYAALKD